MRPIALLVPAMLLLAGVRPLPAQLRADPGVIINGKVIVTVYATLSDLDDPYVPLSRYQLVLYGPQRDSTVLRTDDAGVASVGVPAGNYRLVSSSPYVWKGRQYRWSVPVTVRPGMSVVDLTASNAVAGAPAEPVVAASFAPAPGAPAGRPRASGVAAAPSAGGQAPYYGATGIATPKDGGVAVLFSLLLTGGGQMYGGKPGKGVALLLTSIGAVAVGAAASGCEVSSYSYETDCNVGPLAAGVGVALGNWIYSMVSAPGDVREWNARHAGMSAAARVAPVVSPGAAGTQMGLALRW